MAEAASFDARLQGFDFAELIGRAENQHQKVEERRLACAQSVFRNGDGDGKSGPHTESRHAGGRLPARSRPLTMDLPGSAVDPSR